MCMFFAFHIRLKPFFESELYSGTERRACAINLEIMQMSSALNVSNNIPVLFVKL